MWRGASVIRSGTIDVVVLPPVATDDWRVEDLDEHVAGIRRQYEQTSTTGSSRHGGPLVELAGAGSADRGNANRRQAEEGAARARPRRGGARS